MDAQFEEDFQAQKLDGDSIAKLVGELRLGNLAAKAALINGLMWVVFEVGRKWAGRGRKRCLEDIVGSLTEGLCVVIDRLENGSRVVDVEKSVRDELTRQIKDFARENSRKIHPKASTNSDRKRKGLDEYEPLTRVSGCSSYKALQDDAHGAGCSAEQVEYRGPDLRDEQCYYRGPSRYYNQEDDVAIVDLLDLCDSSEQQATMTLLLKGYDAAEIAVETSTTEYGVRKVKKQIMAKLETEGVRLSLRRRDPLDSTAPLDSVATLSPTAPEPQQSTQELEIAISV